MINNRYKIGTLIGQGSFSAVHKGEDLQTSSQIAIKIFPKALKSFFVVEAEVLAQVSGKKNFPRLLWHGLANDQCYIVMSLLGESLRTILMTKRYSNLKILETGKQILSALESLHKKYYLHRDLKLENIVQGLKHTKQYYLIDFGLSKKYWNISSNFHIPMRTDFKFRGNLIFCSNNILSGVEPSRRDDLVSLCLILLYMQKGDLPWLEYGNSLEEMIGFRSSVSQSDILRGASMELSEFYKYTLNLGFYQTPDYSYLSSLLIRKIKSFRLSEPNITIKTKKKKILSKKSFSASKSQIEEMNHSIIECDTVVIEPPDFSQEMMSKIRDFRTKKLDLNKSS